MMPTQATVDAVNTLGAYGTYIPGRRIEIEKGPWDAEAVSGWGPGVRPLPGDEVWYLVQRDIQSPHPITWHSKAVPYMEAARVLQLRLEIDYDKSRGYDWRLCIPGVSHLAFNEHFSHFGGCDSSTSVSQCAEKKCVEKALRDIDTIIANRDLIKDGLEHGNG